VPAPDYYTETDKALMWERWRQGESLQAIAQNPRAVLHMQHPSLYDQSLGVASTR
jgi:hypothetical protein